jgi:hypothetical protein
MSASLAALLFPCSLRLSAPRLDVQYRVSTLRCDLYYLLLLLFRTQILSAAPPPLLLHSSLA